MKFLAIVGSMRPSGNTNALVAEVLKSARTATDAKTEIIQMSELSIEPCRACFDVCSKTSYECVLRDDLAGTLRKMAVADAIVLGSPLYYIIPSRLTALMERLVVLAFMHDIKFAGMPQPLADKPCGLVAVTAGDNDPDPVIQRLHHFALSLKMSPITMKSYPFLGVAAKGKLESERMYNPLGNARTLGGLLARAAAARTDTASA